MIASPCINICQLDARRGLCQGCWRTIEEITAWARTDDAGRAAILAAAAERRQASLAGDSQPDEPHG